MEFLFLNEDVSSQNALSDIRAFAKENNIECFDEDITLEEALLECEEGIHEAEVKAMTEEFALYQESVLHEGVGDMAKSAWDKLKEWWTTIKGWIIKAIEKVTHWFWVAVNWCRKTMQAAIQKLHGKSTIFVPKSLINGGEFKNLETQFKAGLAELANEKDDADYGKDAKKDIKERLKSVFKSCKEALKSDKTSANYEEMPFGSWKSLMDKSLKDFEATKKAAEEANKKTKEAIKQCDAAFTTGYKPGDDASNTALKKKCVAARNKALVTSRLSAFIVKASRWHMNALFSASSYKAKEPKKD